MENEIIKMAKPQIVTEARATGKKML